MSCGVVLMSACGQRDDVIGALREGAVDYLKTPWSDDELATVVSRAVALHEAMRDTVGCGDLDREAGSAPAVVPADDAVEPTAVADRLLALPDGELPALAQLKTSLSCRVRGGTRARLPLTLPRWPTRTRPHASWS